MVNVNNSDSGDEEFDSDINIYTVAVPTSFTLHCHRFCHSEANHGILHFFVQATRLKVWYSNKIMQHSHSNSFVLNIQ